MSDTVKVKIASDAWVEGWGKWNANDKTLSIELTRAQVEAAVKELNEIKFKAGDVVEHRADPTERWLVIGTAEDHAYYAHLRLVNVTNGRITNRYFVEDLIHHGKLRDR